MKIACIYHSVDLDGWMSAAIVKHWWLESNKKDGEQIAPISFKDDELDTLISSHGTLTFIGYNNGEPAIDLTGYNKVIMCDISFPKDIMANLNEWYGSNFIWIDHHISTILDQEEIYNNKVLAHINYNRITGIRNTKFAACELTWKYFFPNEQMPEIVRLLGRYDCFGHKGTDEEQKVLEFQYGARQCISNYDEAYRELEFSLRTEDNAFNTWYAIWNKGKYIYQYLCTEAKQTYNKGFSIWLYYEYPGKIINTCTPFKFICINKERFNPINFGIDYHADGYDGVACFHYANGKWNFSIYNDNGEVDCSIIAKQFGGGGHKGASGFVVDDINQIIK